jgi:rubrerythrin
MLKSFLLKKIYMSWDSFYKKSKEKANTYEVQIVCRNCSYIGYINIPKGNPVDRKSCPACGCNYLELYQKVKL